MPTDRAGQWHKLPLPEQPKLSPMPYQEIGINWLCRRTNSLLADDMGLGKTNQAIGVINSLPTQARILIVTPAGLRINWLRELALWLTTTRKAVLAKTYIPDAPIVVVSYDALAKHEVHLRATLWDLIICDEVHVIRNAYSSKCRQVLGDGSIEPLKAHRKLLLTGTPMLNRPIELWPLLRFLGLEMDRQSFGDYFCGGGNFQGATNLPALKQLLAPYMLRRLKKDVLTDLPDKTRHITRISPSGAVERLVKAELNFADQAKRVQSYRGKASMSEISALRLATASAKVAMPEVQAILREAVACHGKVVIFCHHNAVVEQLAALFPGECVTYTGSHSSEQRQRNVDRFQSDLGCKVFIGSIGAAGVGITLTAASHMIFVEEDFTPGITQQCEDRIWRYGQKNACVIQHLILDGSYDAREIEIQVEKQEIISAIL